MKPAADAITDVQVRRLRDVLYVAYWKGDHGTWDAINLCRIALSSTDPLHRTSARLRCAEILNARSAP